MAKAKKVDKKGPAKKAVQKKVVKTEKLKKPAKPSKAPAKAAKKEVPKKVAVKPAAKKSADKSAKKVAVKKATTQKQVDRPAKSQTTKKTEPVKPTKSATSKHSKSEAVAIDKQTKKSGAPETSAVATSPIAAKKNEKKALTKPQATAKKDKPSDEATTVGENKSSKKVSAKNTKKPTRDEIDLPEIDDDFGDDDFGGFEVETPKKAKAPAKDDKSEVSSEIILTDAEGRRLCKVPNCDQVSTVEGYCRYHYLLFWKRIQVRKKILSEGKLEKYIEELTSRYPMKYLEMLKKDLRNHQDFLSAIQELEIDDSSNENEFEDEAQNFIDEVRGISGTEGESDDEY